MSDEYAGYQSARLIKSGLESVANAILNAAQKKTAQPIYNITIAYDGDPEEIAERVREAIERRDRRSP